MMGYYTIRYYVRAFLLGVVLGLVILAVLLLFAGCEDNDGQAQAEANAAYEDNQRYLVRKRTIENQAAFQALAKELRNLEQTNSFERVLLDDHQSLIGKQQKLNRDIWGAIESIKRRLVAYEDMPVPLPNVYLSDIDPNAPINTHLLKPSESWAKEYGTSHESVLKYNAVAAWAFAQKALEQIVELDKRVKALEAPIDLNNLSIEAVDPNEVKE